MNRTQRPRSRILIIAYRCTPLQGSEAGVGWGWAQVVAREHDVTVITSTTDFMDIKKWEELHSLDNPIAFRAVPRFRILWLEKLWPPLYLTTYKIWLRRAYGLTKRLHTDTRFDLAHQCTYVGYRVPGHLWKLDIPFVWGPIGGLENTPWRFLPMLGVSGCIYYAGRNIINSLQRRFLPGPKRAFKKAGACGGIIAATAGIQREIRKWYGQESEIICEIGPPPNVASAHSLRENGQPLSIAWSGLHLPGKALPLLLYALAKLPADADWQLKILGEGSCTKKWKRLTEKLGLASRCHWLGWLPRDQAVQEMYSAHVFVITSLKDLTSTVLLEALSQGLPVICPDHCGFSNVVTVDCGIKLPMQSPKQLERDLAKAIMRLYGDEVERRRLADGALVRINDFSWEGKATALNAIYSRAVESYSKANVSSESVTT